MHSYLSFSRMHIFDSNCKKCSLHRERTQVVPGWGDLDSKIVIVGEAPGKEEDEQGQPFVGTAGKVLNGLLKLALNKSRNDFYITNVVKCRPPNNRTPLSEEIKACFSYLKDELRLIQPDIIVALGETASITLTGKGISWRGKVLPLLSDFELPNVPVLITYHPAFIVRTRQYFPLVIWDFEKIPKAHDWLKKKYEERYLINPPLRVILEFFEKYKNSLTAVDIETAKSNERKNGPNPFTDTIIGIAFSAKEGEALHLSGSTLTSAWYHVKSFLETNPNLVYHNNLFDRCFLSVQGIQSNIAWDTYDAMALIYPDLPRDLEFVGSLYENMPLYKEMYKPKLKRKKNLFEQSEVRNLGWYNCRDVDLTLRIAKAQTNYVSSSLMKRYLRYDTEANLMRVRGVTVNRDAIMEHITALKPLVETCGKKFLDEYKTLITSPKQLSHFLFDILKLPDPSGVKSTREESLLRIRASLTGDSESLKILDEVLSYRKHEKLLSTYCEGILQRIDEDGKLHPEWRPLGTDTGRWACRNPNLQNVPVEMRDIIVPAQGKLFICADFDRLEVWIAAILSNDKELLSLLETGVDVHEELRKEIAKYHPSITRTQAKAVLFGTFYGRGARSLAIEHKVPIHVAQSWQEICFFKFTTLKEYFLVKCKEQFESKGYLLTHYGRKRYCETLTQAMNAPIQGTAGEVCAEALLALEKAGFHPVIQVHDDIVCEEDEDFALKNLERFKEIIETANSTIKEVLPVKVKVGKNWKDVKPLSQ